MGKRVILVKSNHRQNQVFHVNRDCRYLNECEESDLRFKQKRPLVEFGYQPCSACTDEREATGGKHDEARTPLRHRIQRGEIDATD
jgi:hypothetical protein